MVIERSKVDSMRQEISSMREEIDRLQHQIQVMINNNRSRNKFIDRLFYRDIDNHENVWYTIPVRENIQDEIGVITTNSYRDRDLYDNSGNSRNLR